MKKTLIIALLFVGTAAGCITWPKDAQSPTAKGNATGASFQPLPPGPITADLVEPGNAHRVAEAVWDEMDRDQQDGTYRNGKGGR
jgi:hypothetical protein